MNQLEFILNSINEDVQSAKFATEMVNMENKANMVSMSVLKTIDSKEFSSNHVSEDIKSVFETEVRKKINILNSVFESPANMIPDELLNDEEVLNLFDNIISKATEAQIVLCFERLAIAANDEKYLRNVKDLLSESINEFVLARNTLTVIIMNKMKAIEDKKIITPVTTPENGNIISIDQYRKQNNIII